MTREDHYAVLGVDRHADEEEIKHAYRRLTWEFHPDRHPGDREAAERYRQINAAYATLSDPRKRSRYDASLRMPQGLDLARGFDSSTARNLLGNVFGDVFGTRRRERRRGRDLRYTLTVGFEEAALGSTHHIEFEAHGPCVDCEGTGTRTGGRPPQTCGVCAGRGDVKGPGLLAPRSRCGRCDGTGMVAVDPCKVCRGRGKRRQRRAFQVVLPPGTDAGAERILTGQGEPGRFGGSSGDLRVKVNVRPHRWLSRNGRHVDCEVPISVTEAARGVRIPVPTVDQVVTMEVPPGVASGTRLRLRGKGIPGPEGPGDQIVTVVVETPVIDDGPPEVVKLLDALEQAVGEAPGASCLPRRHEQRASLAEDPDSEPAAARDSRGANRGRNDGPIE
jgi:molecular chaperone DnaJ